MEEETASLIQAGGMCVCVHVQCPSLRRQLSLEMGETLDSPPRSIDAPGNPTLVQDCGAAFHDLSQHVSSMPCEVTFECCKGILAGQAPTLPSPIPLSMPQECLKRNIPSHTRPLLTKDYSKVLLVVELLLCKLRISHIIP